MLRSDINWYYPTSIEEAIKYLDEETKPHSGGTAILRVKSGRINGLVELSRIDALKGFSETDNGYELGAMLTFTDVSQKITDEHFILNQSLPIAASTLLRNRITLGGSIADAPPWTDLLGPLMVLDAKIEINGNNQGSYSIQQILEDKRLLETSLITKIVAPKQYEKYAFYRCIRVNFDYASFTISIGADVADGKFNRLSVVVFGNKKRYKRLETLEEGLIGQEFTKELFDKRLQKEELAFVGDEKGSSEYLRHLFEVNLFRKLKLLAT